METWKAVPGWEGRYEVSDLGRVRSLDAFVWCDGPVKGKYQSFKKGRVLRPGRMPMGHLSVVLGRSRCVHELVLLAFVGPPPQKHECLHSNGVPYDNRLENLRWGTRSENNIDAVKHGVRGQLKVQEVKDIKGALENSYWGLGRQLAKKYGISAATISAIKVGRHYAHVLY